MRVAHSHRFTGGPAPHCPSGKQDHDRLRAQPSVVVQRRRTVACRGPRVKASHHGDRDHRARRRVAARLRRARPALALRAKASRSAVPAPWPQQTGGRVPRANADHARRANPSVPVCRANLSVSARKFPLTGNRALAARVTRALPGSNLVTAGMTSP